MHRWLPCSNPTSSFPVGSFSSSSAGNPRLPMGFTEKWGEGGVFDWYKDLQKSSILVNRLQVRVDKGTPPHRFVLAYLTDGVVCRFDRRPEDADPSKLMLEAFGREPRQAADEYCTLREGDFKHIEIQRSTICEMDMDMPPDTDLLLILSACFALFQDPVARRYDLLSYNCYFFSWTITTVVVRHKLPFRIPAPTHIAPGLAPELTKLSHPITDKIVKALLEMLLDVLAAARQVAGNEIKKGLDPYELLIWQLPMSVMKFSLRQFLKANTYFGLEDIIRERFHERILDVCTMLLQDVLTQEDIADRVEKRLWINELKEDIRAWLRDRLAVTAWDAVLDGLAAMSENIGRQKPSADNENNSNGQLSPQRPLTNSSQWIQVWGESLGAAFPAARDAVRGKDHTAQPSSIETAQSTSTQLHNQIFDIAFKAGSSSAKAAAKDVVARTQPALNDPKRAQIWETVWNEWDNFWEIAHENTRATVVSIFEKAVDEVVALVTDQVVESVRGNQGQEAQAWAQYTKESRTVLSASDFQERINQLVRSAHPTAGRYAEHIEATMAKVWDTSSQYHRIDHQDMK
ncbi:unnamed protein product [Rhizoctonia solani]|uniref:Uncharacterized protein n=1 Tax=Rhizoctonia solani TaxID=456999 RepID=A0A8H3H9V4_9AGAM|nr:unnamed protein product [Rhizoctonia solani]